GEKLRGAHAMVIDRASIARYLAAVGDATAYRAARRAAAHRTGRAASSAGRLRPDGSLDPGLPAPGRGRLTAEARATQPHPPHSTRRHDASLLKTPRTADRVNLRRRVYPHACVSRMARLS